MQHRRALGRRYPALFAWTSLAANCLVLALFLARFLQGPLPHGLAIRYAFGIAAGFAISGILIFAAKFR